MGSPPPRSGDDRAAALLKERVRRLFREFPGALAGKEEPVHQVRVASRRLRVALPLLAGKARGRRVKRARRILGELTRAAGAGRDLDVLVTLFEQRLAGLDTASAEQREILRRLRVARNRSRSRLADRILDLDIDHLRRDLRRIRARGPADAPTVLERTREAREGDGRELLEGLAAVGGRYDPETLHALRRQIRRLRYTAEVDDAVRGGKSGVATAWKRLQDAIGALHDAHVLAGWLAELAQRASARGQRDLAAAARTERRVFEDESRRLHRELLRTRPTEIVLQALRTVAPLTPDGQPDKGASTSSSSSATRSAYRAAPRASPTPSGP
jgi:CHAD domain-containing protein